MPDATETSERKGGRQSLHPVRRVYHEDAETSARIDALAEKQRLSVSEAQRFVNRVGLSVLVAA